LETARLALRKANAANGAPTPPGLTQSLVDIERATESVQKLVVHLRNFSRGMAEQRETIDIGQSIEDALFLTQSRIRDGKVKVENQVDRGRYFTAGCPNHIEQMFANLISNACDAMADCTERKLVLDIDAARNGDDKEYWQCGVRDSGSGISEKIQETVFESFFTTKDRGNGTGLGLSIVRGIVSDHHGEIEMDSTPGEGTTFRIRLLQCSVAG
jgi:two-component system C4-dicarboxylate transport sensor histidine kinase DctB